MSGSKTAYLSQRLLDHALGGVAYVPPATVWVVLSTAAFTSAATGAACSEVSAGDYVRAEYPNSSATWSPATVGAPSTKSNVVDLVFAAATSSWGVPKSVYLADAATGGNLLFGADVGGGATVDAGDAVLVDASLFTFSDGIAPPSSGGGLHPIGGGLQPSGGGLH